MKRTASAVTPLLPTDQPGGVRYAPAVRAGSWLFATGIKSLDTVDKASPLHGLPKNKIEALGVFKTLGKILKAGGSDPSHVVRVDQYYRHGQVVPMYHEVRRDFFKGHVPPSTSNLHQEFLADGQDMEVQLIAAVAGKGLKPEQHRPKDLPVHASSSYSPVLTCGDFVFVAGQTAEALKSAEGPIDPEARLPAGHLWKGSPIKL
ncbi:MAG: RidA family protein, partial [Betaproteobacteria bacterium]